MKIPLTTLIGWTKQAAYQSAIDARTVQPGQTPYADTVGVHFYSQLDTLLELSAAEGENNASTLLRMLQEYATAAQAAGDAAGFLIFEVQGQRLHLFREGQLSAQQAENIVVEFARTFHRLAEQKIAATAPRQAFHLRIAADHGRAVVIRSMGTDQSESVVSLGVPANRPAKLLAKNVNNGGVPAGHLALNIASFAHPEEELWKYYDLAPSSEPSKKSSLEEAALHNFSKIAASRQIALSARDYATNPANPVQVPIRRQGFMLRADLDGFSKRVKVAMSSGEQAVVKMVLEFSELMKYPAYYKERLPVGVSVLLFPWAGDCANIFLVCEDYSFQRTSLPNRAAIEWHEMTPNGNDTSRPNWQNLMADSRWLVAMAGGENHGSDHGYIMTGNVVASDRLFHIGAGWGWGRSLDAEQSLGTKPDQTIIQIEDYSGLDSTLRSAYHDHPNNPTLFKVADLQTLLKTAREHRAAAAKSVGTLVPRTSIVTPIPRSHGY